MLSQLNKTRVKTKRTPFGALSGFSAKNLSSNIVGELCGLDTVGEFSTGWEVCVIFTNFDYNNLTVAVKFFT